MSIDTLSARELQVLRLIAQGLANKRIGQMLGISERTVKVHVGHLFRRLGIADRTSTAMWARDNLPGPGPESIRTARPGWVTDHGLQRLERRYLS